MMIESSILRAQYQGFLVEMNGAGNEVLFVWEILFHVVPARRNGRFLRSQAEGGRANT